MLTKGFGIGLGLIAAPGIADAVALNIGGVVTTQAMTLSAVGLGLAFVLTSIGVGIAKAIRTR